MKYGFILSIISLSVFANDYQDFFGSYKAVGGTNCEGNKYENIVIEKSYFNNTYADNLIIRAQVTSGSKSSISFNGIGRGEQTVGSLIGQIMGGKQCRQSNSDFDDGTLFTESKSCGFLSRYHTDTEMRYLNKKQIHINYTGGSETNNFECIFERNSDI